MLDNVKNYLRGKLIGQDTQAILDFYSRAGKMDTGFKWGEDLVSSDLEFAVRRDVLSWRLTHGMAYELFRRGFVVEKTTRRREQPGDVDDDLTDEVMDTLDEVDGIKRLAEGVGYERQYGWSIIAILRDKQAPSYLEPKSPRQINRLHFDEKGWPLQYEIQRHLGVNIKYLWMDKENTVHIRTRPRDDLPIHEGISVLENPWDILETNRKIVWGAGQRFYRYGGLLVLKIARANQDKLEEYRKKFGPLGPRTDVFLDDQSSLEMPGLGGAGLDPTNYVDVMLTQISIQTGIPLDVLRGESEATLASGAISHHSYFSYLSAQQITLIPVVTDLLAKLGLVLPDDRTLKFRLEYELDPKDESLVKLNETETIKRRDWFTPNEKRAIDPIKHGPIEGGNRLPASGFGQGQQPGNMGQQQPRSPGVDNAEVNHPMYTDNLKHYLVRQVDKLRESGKSAKDACAQVMRETDLKISRTSYYRWKEAYG